MIHCVTKLGCVAFLISPALAQNECATAVPIQGLGTWSYDRTGAGDSDFVTSGGGCSHLLQVSDDDVFFSWTAEVTGAYLFTAADPAEDTQIRLFSGLGCSGFCYPFQSLHFNDVLGTWAAVDAFFVDAGDVLTIQIGSKDEGVAGGLGDLIVEMRPPMPANNSCSTAIQVSGTVAIDWSNLWASSTSFQGGAGFCNPSYLWDGPTWDVFYQWTATESGDFVIDTTRSLEAIKINLAEGAGCTATCMTPLNFSARHVIEGVEAGDQILLQCGGRRRQITNGHIEIYPYVGTTHDDCSSAEQLAGSGPWAFDNLGAGTSYFDAGDSNCHGSHGGVYCYSELWEICVYDPDISNPEEFDTFHTWTAPCDGTYDLSIGTDQVQFNYNDSGMPWGAAVSVYAGGDCLSTCIGSADAGPGEPPFTFTAVGGQSYLIQVANEFIQGELHLDRQAGLCNDGLSITCDPPLAHYLGGSVTLEASSFLSPGVGGLHVEATGGPPNEFGFFLIAPTATSSLSVFNGTLCLDAPLGRYNNKIAGNQSLPQLNSVGLFDGSGVLQNLAGTSTSGSGFDVPVELPYSPTGQVIAPGDTWAIQLWYRDRIGMPPTPGSSANFSNVLLATFP